VPKHSLIRTLVTLTGNPRGCVYTEPLWGIPYNLYTPYVSVFMVALGLSDHDIGLIISLSWGSQLIFALLSGVITDKFGRRRTTLLFDIFSWTVPAVIWAFSRSGRDLGLLSKLLVVPDRRRGQRHLARDPQFLDLSSGRGCRS